MTTLFRASLELTTEGRTLVGVAMPWEKPTLVRDSTGPSYLESFSRTSTDVTLTQRTDPRPVFVRHDYTQDPLGVVTFTRSSEGLMFTAPLSQTARADEMLSLVNDGAMRSVSVGFRPIQSRKQGDVLVRTEVALRELSLAPTGFGQYEDAQVLAVRAETEGTPRLDVLRRRKLFL